MKIPMPAAIANLRFTGMPARIHLLNGVRLMTIKSMLDKNTAPRATCQLYPSSPTTVKVKKALNPTPGARATGQFATIPIANVAKAAAKQVAVKLAP